MAELNLKKSIETEPAPDDQRIRNYIDRQCDEILKAMGEIFAGHRATVSTMIDKLKQRVTRLEGQVEDLKKAVDHNGVTLAIRGTYDARERYKQLDIVVLDGAAFVSKRDNPGFCPASGDWQLIAKQGRVGKPGRQGERGLRGEKGDPGLSVAEYHPDVDHWRFVTIMSDGSGGAILDLQTMVERLRHEILSQVNS
jgi:hypothetical protein